MASAQYRAWFWLRAVAGGLACLALGIALTGLHPFKPTQVVVALIVTAVGTLFSSPSSPPTKVRVASKPSMEPST